LPSRFTRVAKGVSPDAGVAAGLCFAADAGAALCLAALIKPRLAFRFEHQHLSGYRVAIDAREASHTLCVVMPPGNESDATELTRTPMAENSSAM
jgi:hypothetical protein